jgi:hypothetical protein
LQTTNLHYSAHERIVSAVLGDWARFLGVLYVERAQSDRVFEGMPDPEETTLEELAALPCLCWIAPQDVAVRFQAMVRPRRVIATPLWGPLVDVMARSVTAIPQIESMDIKSIEYNDRWAIVVTTSLKLWWEHPNHFTARHVAQPPAEGRAEVLR